MAEVSYTYDQGQVNEDPISIYQMCKEVDKTYSSAAFEAPDYSVVENADYEMGGYSAFPVGKATFRNSVLQTFIDPIAGVSPVCMIDTLNGKWPQDLEVGFHKPMFGDLMINTQALTVFIAEKNKTDIVMLQGTCFIYCFLACMSSWGLWDLGGRSVGSQPSNPCDEAPSSQQSGY